MSHVIHDFSKASIDAVEEIAINKVDKEEQWGFVDWFDDTFLTRKLDIHQHLQDLQRYHERMMDKYDIGEKKLKTIVKNVTLVDDTHSKVWANINTELDLVLNKIKALNEVIQPSNLAYVSKDTLKARLNKMDQKYQEEMDKADANIEIGEITAGVIGIYEMVQGGTFVLAGIAGEAGGTLVMATGIGLPVGCLVTASSAGLVVAGGASFVMGITTAGSSFGKAGKPMEDTKVDLHDVQEVDSTLEPASEGASGAKLIKSADDVIYNGKSVDKAFGKHGKDFGSYPDGSSASVKLFEQEVKELINSGVKKRGTWYSHL